MFADAATSLSPELLGLLVVGLIILARLAVDLKSLLSKPSVSSQDEFVRRSELAEKLDTLATKIVEVSEYSHKSNHENREALYQIGLRMESSHRETSTQLARLSTIIEREFNYRDPPRRDGRDGREDRRPEAA